MLLISYNGLVTTVNQGHMALQEIRKETPKVEKAAAKGRPKPKGRPEGSQNKQPSKPRVKKVVVEEAIEEEALPYEPSSPKRNLRIPTDPNVSEVAKAMLDLLQNQTNTRQARRERLHRSWFQ